MPTPASSVDGEMFCCPYLMSGQSYSGTQRVAHSRSGEDWTVNVKIQTFQPENGYINGVMEAVNVPSIESSVLTFWEGEIVNGIQHGFYTKKWRTNRENDLQHWSKFDGFRATFLNPDNEELHHELSSSDCIFMRWKEQFFINVNSNCGLTIAGFYYICLNRKKGTIEGFYYDPDSSPFQRLSMKNMSCVDGPPTFPDFSFA
eukprot:TRINITY_DN12928_c0_g1_i1.p1 TRINITY_DN12928_c0_g1~~TRINITY_DN12928_c0_g1_i1.p1  ORF type:complete len:202 (+),score=45.56 TRINITY_DN12928_c0_g1_i1:73-678(+)